MIKDFSAILKLKSGTSSTRITRLSIQPYHTIIIAMELLSTLFPSISASLKIFAMIFNKVRLGEFLIMIFEARVTDL